VIEKCEAATAADGARCGAQLANDPTVSLVLTGTLVEGNAELYDALDGEKAVIIGNGVTPADFLTTAGEAFVPGSPGVLAGMAKFAVDQLEPTTVAIVANDNDAGHAGVTTSCSRSSSRPGPP
jgi:branched-chain amino acid transport system substrate-binding protein